MAKPPGCTCPPSSLREDPNYALSTVAYSNDSAILDILPKDLFVQILQQINVKEDRDSCSIVNKKWFRIERMSRISIRIPGSSLTLLSIGILSTRYPYIECLRIDGCNISSATSLCTKCSECWMGMGGLFALGNMWSKVMDLDLSYLDLSDIDFTHLVSGCGKNLKKLNICHCDKLTDISIQSSASHCTKLERLVLHSPKISTNDALKDVIVRCSNSLKNLVLWLRMGDDVVQKVGHCSFLETLILHGSEFTDRGLLAIGKGCTRLKHLIVNYRKLFS